MAFRDWPTLFHMISKSVFSVLHSNPNIKFWVVNGVHTLFPFFFLNLQFTSGFTCWSKIWWGHSLYGQAIYALEGSWIWKDCESGRSTRLSCWPASGPAQKKPKLPTKLSLWSLRWIGVGLGSPCSLSNAENSIWRSSIIFQSEEK